MITLALACTGGPAVDSQPPSRESGPAGHSAPAESRPSGGETGDPGLTDGEDGTWNSEGVQSPSALFDGDTWRLVFSGRASGDFSVGGATGEGPTALEELPDNPLPSGLGDDGWRSHAAHAPSALDDEGVTKLWFAGRRAADAHWTIGLASSEDGLAFSDAKDNPLLSSEAGWEGDSLSHPSVLRRGEVYEMWYAADDRAIGYALSADGLSWTRYCMNPVFEGSSQTWEEGQVTAPAVLHDGERYLMGYTAGGDGDWALGFAASRDGIRWTRHEESVLSPDDEDAGEFESTSLFGPALFLDGGTLHLWYGASSTSGAGIGHAAAAWSAK